MLNGIVPEYDGQSSTALVHLKGYLSAFGFAGRMGTPVTPGLKNKWVVVLLIEDMEKICHYWPINIPRDTVFRSAIRDSRL